MYRQTYFYAIHPEIRSRYFALCNGREFAIFEKDQPEMALHFHVEKNGATIEDINSELIIKGIELGFLDLLSKKYDDLSPLLDSYFDLDPKTQQYQMPANKQFKSAIPLELRLRYFLLSYLRRKRQARVDPDFSQIVQAIMPMLKNGLTPERQTILNVLRDLARELPNGRWRLRDTGQQRFEDF